MEDLGAGEILLNCIDNDGVGQGFDLALVAAVAGARGGQAWQGPVWQEGGRVPRHSMPPDARASVSLPPPRSHPQTR